INPTPVVIHIFLCIYKKWRKIPYPDAGASKTFPQQAATMRKNDYIVIKNRHFKHGHTKCHFVGIDIFTGPSCSLRMDLSRMDLVVSDMSAMGEEKIHALKDIGPK
ncbi:hypothetical protein Lal_00018402, partial [Lupinus albus]